MTEYKIFELQDHKLFNEEDNSGYYTRVTRGYFLKSVDTGFNPFLTYLEAESYLAANKNKFKGMSLVIMQVYNIPFID